MSSKCAQDVSTYSLTPSLPSPLGVVLYRSRPKAQARCFFQGRGYVSLRAIEGELEAGAQCQLGGDGRGKRAARAEHVSRVLPWRLQLHAVILAPKKIDRATPLDETFDDDSLRAQINQGAGSFRS